MDGLLSQNIRIAKVADHATAAQTDVESASVDMADANGVLFRTSLGVAAADNTIKAQQSDDDNVADAWSDIEGTLLASGTAEDLILDIRRPTKRYVRVVVTRGTSSTCESIWADVYGLRSLPIDNSVSGTQIVEAHDMPDEGTA